MLILLSTLMDTKKHGKTVAAYMTKIKSLVDDLALIGQNLSDVEILARTLNGLADDFKELTATIRVCDTPISFEDLYEKLLDEELVHNRGEPKEDDIRITAQFTQRRQNFRGHGGRGNRGGFQSSHRNNTSYSNFSLGPPSNYNSQFPHARPPSSYGRPPQLSSVMGSPSHS
ncbi:uncharacterized protein LOC120005993 [Tripterygium wilfordii]|uniref:uncharacterized protein LOC120005993 n=1 Tax=Tripterygium wilfordii TaxID=458696 RepID=UPI0018F8476A|nr:uncharacterized protein LOC120005993 [Tripterygium wilfordii]